MTAKFRYETASKTDERVRLVDEIISGIEMIKCYAWEKPFCSMVEIVRRLELKFIKKNAYLRGIFITFILFTTRVALYFTLMAMLVNGESLTAERVFVFSFYLDILSQGMSQYFVRAIAEVSECLVSLRRLQNFLMSEEFKDVGLTNDSTIKDSNNDGNYNFLYEDSGICFNQKNIKREKKQNVTILNTASIKKTSSEKGNIRESTDKSVYNFNPKKLSI